MQSSFRVPFPRLDLPHGIQGGVRSLVHGGLHHWRHLSTQQGCHWTWSIWLPATAAIAGFRDALHSGACYWAWTQPHDYHSSSQDSAFLCPASWRVPSNYPNWSCVQAGTSNLGTFPIWREVDDFSPLSGQLSIIPQHQAPLLTPERAQLNCP